MTAQNGCRWQQKERRQYSTWASTFTKKLTLYGEVLCSVLGFFLTLLSAFGDDMGGLWGQEMEKALLY